MPIRTSRRRLQVFEVVILLCLCACLAGCVSSLRAVYPDQIRSRPPQARFDQEAGGVRLVLEVQDTTPEVVPNLLPYLAGGLGDLLLGGYGASLAVRGSTAAPVISVLSGGGLLGADLIAVWLFAPVPAVPADRFEGAKAELWDARAAVPILSSPVAARGSKDGMAEFESFLPIHRGLLAKQLLVRVLDGKGLVAERIQLWIPAVAGSATTLFQEPAEGRPGRRFLMTYGADFWEGLSDAPPPVADVSRMVMSSPVLPAKLETAVEIKGLGRSQVLNAGESLALAVRVRNRGTGPAKGTKAILFREKDVPGVRMPTMLRVGDLAPGAERSVTARIEATREAADGTMTLRVAAEDERNVDSIPTRVVFMVRAERPPSLAIGALAVDDGRDGIPERGEQLRLQVAVRNKGQGPARAVRATLVIGDAQIVPLEGVTAFLPDIGPGATSIATFSLFVKNAYAGPAKLPLQVRIDEGRPNLGIVSALPVSLGESAPRFLELRVEPQTIQQGPEGLADLGIDVDKPFPAKRRNDADAVAVVIGIERYNARVAGVPYALRDATIMREYFTHLLGVADDNLLFLTNERATKAEIETALEGQLPGQVVAGKSHVYVYYAGHGAPDVAKGTPYLVPYDGNPDYPKQSCYPLSSFYASLEALKAASVTVFLDACFTGSTGRGGAIHPLLSGTRPIAIAPTRAAIPSGTVVFAAASGAQVSSDLPAMKHGLFTYFLLKGLRGEGGSNGRVTVKSLGDYLARMVPAQARRLGRNQTPSVMGDSDDRTLVGP